MNRGLARYYLETQYGVEFIIHVDWVHGTTVDFYWHPPIRLAFFLDGVAIGKSGVPKLHLTRVQSYRDDRVDEALRNRGITVLRLQYRYPLRKYRKRQIVDKAEITLYQLGYRRTPRRPWVTLP